jgi:hypothetical protein
MTAVGRRQDPSKTPPDLTAILVSPAEKVEAGGHRE